jgi:type IV secretion system protein VirB5
MSEAVIPEMDGKEVSQPNGAAGDNPHDGTWQHLTHREERAVSSARVWQIYGTAGLLAALGSVAGWTHVASQPRFVPYVVEVDKLGEAVAVRPASGAAQADVRVIRAQLASFIWSARMVSSDGAVEKRAIQLVWNMTKTKDPASARIQEWWNDRTKSDPWSRAANETVDVDIETTLPISDSAWQVEWLESVRDRDGNLKEPPYRMRATLTIYMAPLERGATEAAIQANPMGVYVREFSWTRINR